jgi:hypothetical protein
MFHGIWKLPQYLSKFRKTAIKQPYFFTEMLKLSPVISVTSQLIFLPDIKLFRRNKGT